jgi:serine/threonine protein kinase
MAGEMKPDAPVSSLPDFLVAIGCSGVLTEEQLEALRDQVSSGAYPCDPPKLADHLVGEKLLTEFQARMLLEGNSHALVIGRYTLLDRIGAGGMGWVFRARHQLMDRIVALKVISPESSAKPNATARFLREMKLVGQLDHPNLIRAFDADLYNGIHYIVMEYVSGQDLRQIYRRRGVLPPDEVANYVAQAARGLAHAHDKKMIHRDIKPSNLLIGTAGVLKVLDLGLGAFVEDFGQGSRVTDADERLAVGTIEYVAPEQLTGEIVDGRADLFSLGCTAYGLLSGKLAYPGKSKRERLFKRISERHVPLLDVRPGLPPGLVAAVDRLLATKPADRFATGAEAADAFEALIRPEDRSPSGLMSERHRTPAATTNDLSLEPDLPPLDWSLIEAALRPKADRLQVSPSPGKPTESRSPRHSEQVLDLHRRELEASGTASGRDIEQLYFLETVKLKRAANKQPEPAKTAEKSLPIDRRLEYVFELLEGVVTDPSPTLIAVAILAIILVVAIAVVAVLF